MEEINQLFGSLIDYDVIFVGQLGAVVSNILLSNYSDLYKCLVINNCKQINQPSLLPVQNPVIRIDKNCPRNCDFQNEKIYRIYPQKNIIAIENRKCYRYKFLVYTADIMQWSDFSNIQNLQQALKTNYSFVYSNILKTEPELSNPNNIFKQFQRGKELEIRRFSIQSSNQRNKLRTSNCENTYTDRILCQQSAINIIFYLPKPPHSGYDNLNILYKLDQFYQYFKNKINKFNKQISSKTQSKQKMKSCQKQLQKLNFILCLQDQHIFPTCIEIDNFVKQKMQEKGVKILKNHKIQKIDYLRRKIIVNYIQKDQSENDNNSVSIIIKNKRTLKFDYLYLSVKQRTPNILLESGIDPFQNCPKTLANSKYKDIFIFGADIFPTTHSYNSINHQAHIISTNIIRLLKNYRKVDTNLESNLKQYNGFTEFYFWTSRNSFVKLEHEYDNLKDSKRQNKNKHKSGKFSIRSPNCCFSLIESVKNRFVYGLQARFFYNMKTYGAPYYFFVPVQQASKV